MTTLRINNKDKKRLDMICRKARFSQAEVFCLIIVALKKQRMAKRLKCDFESLAVDASAMKNYAKDSQILDQASFDGLLEGCRRIIPLG